MATAPPVVASALLEAIFFFNLFVIYHDCINDGAIIITKVFAKHIRTVPFIVLAIELEPVL